MTFAPICVRCQHEMRCRRNDYLFADYDGAAIWAGDMYECEDCKARIVVGVAREPVAYKGEVRYQQCIPRFELTREVRDERGRRVASIWPSGV